MRLIDADALKLDLTRFYDNEVTAKQLIDEQPTVGGWVSVKDRLPGPFINCLGYGSGKYALSSGEWLPAFVTHWMPLTEPQEDDA